jgi:hypothetical protein
MEDKSEHIPLFNQKRRKLVHSVKRIYSSEITFTDPLTEDKRNFRIFKDSDIGLSPYWQNYIKESKADEDIPTDDELLTNATEFNRKNLHTALLQVYEQRNTSQKDLIHNLYLLSQ